MTTPTLALGVSAAGAQTVADLAAAVGTLKNNLAQLAAVAGGSNLHNLDGLTKEFREMRQELVATMQGLRTDLAAGFKQAFDAAAAQAKAGGERVESEVKKAGAKVRVAAKGIDLGSGIAASVSGAGLQTEVAVRKMAETLMKLPAAQKAVQDKLLRDQLEFEGKQKAMWVKHLEEMHAKLAREKHAMGEAVAQFRAIKATELAVQTAFEEKQKAQWIAHEAERAKRMARERTMMSEAAAQFRRHQQETLAATVRGQVGQAMATGGIVGPFSSIAAGSYGALKNVPDEAEKAKHSVRGLTKELNDAHSAARGVASGFGAMWLTWGNIAPLLAGAALSHSFVQAIKMGAEVQNTLATIRSLSQETEGAVAGLNVQMLELARSGPFGPREIANAMKTLSLAGLNAREVMTSVKDVLNFAVAGNTTIEKAADVMTSVATAFRITADGYNYVGDVIAKTAAVSKASVESIGEAFKTASVVHSQYGVSLEDVGAGLALLSNVSIQGTAAGTSLRNMYVDLLGRTPKVRAAIKELTGDAEAFIDKTTGKAKGLVDIFSILEKNLGRFTPTSQTRIIQDIFSERGGKEAIEVLEAIRRKAREMGDTFENELDRIRRSIAASAGFMAASAAQMSLTPLNQMKSVVATLQATMVEQFNVLQPYIIDTSEKLKQLFNSSEFKTGLRNMVVGMAEITSMFLRNLDVVATLLAAWVGFKIANAIAAGFTLLAERVAIYSLAASAATKQTVQLTLAQQAQQAALAGGATSVAAKAASLSGLLTVGARFLPWIGLAITAWSMYSFWTDKSRVSNAEFAGTQHSALISALRKERERLDELNNAKAQGLSLDLMRARNQVGLQAGDINTPVELARDKLNTLREQQKTTGSITATGTRLPAMIKAQEAEVARQETIAMSRRRELQRELEALQNSATLRADQVKKEAEEEAKRFRKSWQVYSPPGRGGEGSGNGVEDDNTMSTLNAMLQARESALKTAYDKEMRLLDLKHRGELISEGEYQALVLRRTEQFETQHRGLVLAEMAAMKQVYEQRKAQFAGNSQELKNLENDYVRFTETAKSTLSKLDSDAFERQQRAIIGLDIEVKKLTKSNEEYWQKAEATSKKSAAIAKARSDSLGMSDEQRAALEATVRVEEQHALHIEKLEQEYYKAAEALAYFTDKQQDDESATEGSVLHYQGLIKQLYGLAAALELSAKKVDDLKKAAATTAVQEVQNKKLSEMSKTLGDAITDSILNGGQEGGRRLKDWLKNYFIREPLRIAIQAIVQPFMQGLSGGGGIGGGLMQLLGSGGAAGGGGGISGAMQAMLGGGGGSGLGGMFGFPGGGSFMNSINSSLFGTGGGGSAIATSAGALESGVMVEGVGGTAGLLGGAGSAMSSAIPYIGALFAASQGNYGQAAGMAIGTAIMPGIGTIIGAVLGSLIKTKPGGPKVDGRFGTLGSQIASGTTDTQSNAAAKTSAKALQTQYDTIVKSLGGTGGLEFGLGFSMDPKGTAPTMLDVTASRGGQVAYNDYSLSIGRKQEELEAAIGQMGSKAILAGLQQSNIAGQIGEYLQSLGDVAQLSADTITEAIARIQKAGAEKQALEERWYLMTSTAEQQLAKARAAEREALDESNRALLDRIHALEDERNAQVRAKQAIDRARESSSQAMQFIAGVQSNIGGYLDRLNGTPSGLLTPEAQLANAKSQFNRQLGLAGAGNRDALQGITGYADQLISAQTAYTASGPATVETIDFVKSALAGLPQMLSSEEFLASVIRESAGKTVFSIQELQGAVTVGFDDFDTSLDGAIDFTELKTYFNGLATDEALREIISIADADKNGSLTRMELINASVIVTSAREVAAIAATAIPQATPTTVAAAATAVTPQQALNDFRAQVFGPIFGGVWGDLFGSEGPGDGGPSSSGGTDGIGDSAAAGVGGGGYAVGTNRVPYDMITRVHKDERIVPAWDNPYASPYTSDQVILQEVLEELRALRAITASAGGQSVALAREIRDNTADTAQTGKQKAFNERLRPVIS